MRKLLTILLILATAATFGQANQVDVKKAVIRDWIIYQGDTLAIASISGDTIFVTRGATLDTLISGEAYWSQKGSYLYPSGDWNVGIGTTTPDEELEVVGNFQVSDTSLLKGLIYASGVPYAPIQVIEHQVMLIDTATGRVISAPFSEVADSLAYEGGFWERDSMNGIIYPKDTADNLRVNGTAQSLFRDKDGDDLMLIDHDEEDVVIGDVDELDAGVGKLYVNGYSTGDYPNFTAYINGPLYSQGQSSLGYDEISYIIGIDTVPALTYAVLPNFGDFDNFYGVFEITAAYIGNKDGYSLNGKIIVNYSCDWSGTFNVRDSVVTEVIGNLKDSLFIVSPRLSIGGDSLLIPIYSRMKDDRAISLNIKLWNDNNQLTDNSLMNLVGDLTNRVVTWPGKYNVYSYGNTFWKDATVSAYSLAGGVNAPSLVTLKAPISGLGFNYQTANDIAYGQAQLNHDYKLGTDIEAHIHWSIDQAPAGGNDTIALKFSYTWADINEAFPTATTDTTLIVVNSSTELVHYLTELASPITGSGGDGLSSVIAFSIERLQDYSKDTYPSWFILLDVDFHHQVDSPGSDEELVK